MKTFSITLLFLFSCLFVDAQIIYITPAGIGDGSSWANARGDLKLALDGAVAGQQVWVSAGTYLPHPTDRNASFIVNNGVALYGGFAGTEINLNERNPQINLTILSGAIGSAADDDNAYTVIRSNNVTAATVLDGLIIEYGYANGTMGGFEGNTRSGGGYYNRASFGSDSSPTVNNCIFRNNFVFGFGAGYANLTDGGTCNSQITNCQFINNISENDAAGLYNSGKSGGACNPIITDCLFQGNSTINGVGGGLYNNGQNGLCSPMVDRCRFISNTAGYAGGAVYNFGKDGESSPLISNCLLLNNSATFGGGGIYSLSESAGIASPKVVNCTFTGNQSEVGGAMYNNAGTPTGNASAQITNCIFWGNIAPNGRNFRNNYGTPTISYSIVDVADCNALNSGTASNVTCGNGMIFNQDPQLDGSQQIPVGSPAANAGNTGLVNSLNLTLDLAQNPRINNAIVDLGAFELQSAPQDSDGDGIDNDLDNCPLIANVGQLDADNDNFGTVCDCDDTEATVNDNAPEICDGLDNNCDGIIDEGFDQDGDGFTICQNDCDDNDPTIFPGATEICDGVDNNCNGTLDEGATLVLHYPDVDADLKGDANATPSMTCPPPIGWVSNNEDCDDNNAYLPAPPGTPCDDGNFGTISDVIQADGCTCMGVPGSNGYCPSNGNMPWIQWIGNVSFNTINNNSGKNGYGDFLYISTTIDAGTTYPVSLQALFSYPHFNEYFRVWIDYNQDDDFDDPGEVAFEGIHPTGPDGTIAPPLTGNIIIPTDAIPGNTRMRVSMQPDEYAEPCESFEFGEVEDYRIIIVNNGQILTLNCSADITASALPGASSTAVSWIEPLTTTTCPGNLVNLNQTAGLNNGSNFPVGVTTVSYEATDDCNNVETCNFTVTVDAQPATLTISCPNNIQALAPPGANSVPVSWAAPTANGNCSTGTISITQTAGPASGQSFPVGVTTVTFEAADECSNLETCSFTVTVTGTPPGMGYCQASATAPWEEWIGNVIFNDINNTSGKNGYGNFTSLSTTADLGSTYQISVAPIFSYTHHTEYLSVWIDFNQNENFTDPGEMVFSANYPGGIDGSIAPPFVGDITIPTNALSGTTRMRVIMKRDEAPLPCGIFSTGEVEDYSIEIINNGPILSLDCPVDDVISAGVGATSGVISWLVPAVSSTCPTGAVSLVQTAGPVNGSNQPIGVYTISYEATDECSNIENCSFVIDITSDPATLALTCPPSQNIVVAPGISSATTTWNLPVASSTCPTGNIDLTQIAGPTPGSSFPLGITTITYEANDDCVNIETCSFIINVSQEPAILSITCPNNIIINAPSGTTTAPASWSAPTTVSTCTTGTIDLIQTSGPTSGSNFSVGSTTISYEATDDCGNVETCSFTVTVIGGPTGMGYCEARATAPWEEWIGRVVFNDIDNTSQKNGYSDFTNISTDIDLGANYQINVYPTFSYTHFTENLRVWIDFNQNEDFNDPGEMVFESAYPGGFAGSVAPPFSGNITIPSDATSGNTRMRVIMNRTDMPVSCGLFGAGEVEDYSINIINSGPTLSLSCPGNSTISAGIGGTSSIISWTEPTAVSTCPTATTTLTQSSGPINGSVQPIGNYNINYEAVDDCGNTKNCSFTINITSDPATLNLVCPTNQTINIPTGTTSGEVNWFTPVPATTCPGEEVTLEQIVGLISGSNFPIGNTTITYEATDACGNIETCSFVITVISGTPGVYCAASGNQPWEEWIGTVNFGAINNTSFKSQYSNFTSQSTSINVGDSYPISITPIFSYTHFDEYVRVFIDFNGDLDFADAGEIAFSGILIAGPDGSVAPPITGDIVVPANAIIGSTRMRITMQRGAYATACGSFDRGEVEDYTVNIGQITNIITNRLNDLLTLDAYQTNRSVRLNWTSNLDVTTTAYWVERSTNGEAFVRLDEILAIGNDRSPRYYQYKDLLPMAGKNDYRIIAKQQDGQGKRSEIKTIHLDKPSNALMVFPNPAEDQVFFSAPKLAGRSTVVIISDLLGQVVQQFAYDEWPTDPIRLDLRNWNNGMYVISIKATGRKRVVGRFLVERE